MILRACALVQQPYSLSVAEAYFSQVGHDSKQKHTHTAPRPVPLVCVLVRQTLPTAAAPCFFFAVKNSELCDGACANTSWRSSTRDEEPRMRKQKPRERLWVASELAEHFCHSLTLRTSVFPLSIRLLFGPITRPTIKKSTSVADLDSNQEVGGGAKASGCLMFEW